MRSLSLKPNESASDCTDEDGRAARSEKKPRGRKPQTRGELCAASRRDASNCIALHSPKREVRPEGFEPPTLGSEDRCAIQLRHGRKPYVACICVDFCFNPEGGIFSPVVPKRFKPTGLKMGYFESSKAKGIKLSLSWVQGRYWKKKVAGKQHYFKHPNTAAGYEAALAEWAKSQETPEPDDPDQMRPFLKKVIEWYEHHGDPDNRAKALKQFLDAKYRPSHEGFRLPPQFSTSSSSELASLLLGESYAKDELGNRRLWRERFDQPTRKKGVTIHEGINRFLAEQLQKVKVGKRKPSTYGAWADRLGHAQLHVSGVVEAINSETLSNYYKFLTHSSLGGQRQKNIFKAFKSFVRWAWQEELLDELPRNINRTFEFSEDTRDHASMLFSSPEVKATLKKLPVRGRAAVLLGLNCGFTVGDIADLRKANVDLNGGRIVYKRIKTRGRKHTPTVNYKIWPETIDALREACSSDPELWFLTEDGLPLKESKIVGNKESKWSALTRQWQRWQESGDVPDKPQKGLRKTSATLIESKFPGWEETFLGHAPTTVAGRHYVVKDGKPSPEFDLVLDWLREQLLVSNASLVPAGRKERSRSATQTTAN